MLRTARVCAAILLGLCTALSKGQIVSPVGSTTLEEILITAQRRDELIQDVPTSVVAFTGEQLRLAAVDTLKDLQLLVPGLSLQSSSSIDNLRIIMRGVGSVGDSSIPPSVGTYIDGEYIARPGALLHTLLDVEAVEVLRGPQGTLFGRNSTVGVMNIRTAVPTAGALTGRVQAIAGSDNLLAVRAAANFPLDERLTARLAGAYSEQDGWGRNMLAGEPTRLGKTNDLVFRGKLQLVASNRLSATLRYDLSRLESDGETIEVLSSTVTPANIGSLSFVSGGALPDASDTFDYHVNQRHSDADEITQSGTGLRIRFDSESGYSLSSTTSYRDWEYLSLRDPVRLPLDVNGQNFVKKTDTLSQEFQLLSPDDAKVEYVLGLYYYDEKFAVSEGRDLGTDFCGTIVANLELAGLIPAGTASACLASPQTDAVTARFEQNVKSYSVFAQGSVDVTERFRATVGLRSTSDELDGFYGSTTFNPVVAALAIATEPGRDLSFEDDRTTYLASIDFRPIPDVMLYARYTSGYKSGGFNSDIPSTVALTDDQRVFASEKAKNFELGVKSGWLSDRLVANASWFSGEIDDFQDRAFDGIGFVVTNAGSLDISGLEFDVQAQPNDNLFLSVGGSYLDSEFGSYPNAPSLPGLAGTQDLSGERSHFSPKWQFATVFQWNGRLAGSGWDWFVRGEHAYVAKQNVGATTNQSSQTLQESTAITNLRVGFGRGENPWEAIVYVDNLTDERYCQVDFEQPFAQGLGVRDGAGGSLHRCVLSAPRTAGIRFSLNF